MEWLDAMAQFVCENILKRARQFDEAARISSVSRRDADNGVLVRLVTTAGSLGMVQALRDAWPLASVSLVENLVDGRTEAQVLLPNEAEQRQVAKAIAQFSRWQEPLRKLANVLIALLAIVCARALAEISRD